MAKIYTLYYILFYILWVANSYIAPSITRGVFSSGVVCTLNAKTASTCCFIKYYYNIIIYNPRVVLLELVSEVCGFNVRKSNESFSSAQARTRLCATATATPQRYDTILWSFVDFSNMIYDYNDISYKIKLWTYEWAVYVPPVRINLAWYYLDSRK